MSRSRVLLFALILALPFIMTGCLKTKAAPVMPPREQAESDDYRRHEEWFRFQRMYPNNSIPVDARRKAWEALRKEGALNPQASAAAWTPVGPLSSTTGFPDPLETGRINAVAISPADNHIVLVGGASGGIWRSTDAGSTFVPVSDDQVDLAVGGISFASSNPSIVYAGMGDGFGGIIGTGVLKSTDAGESWTRVDNGSLPEPGVVTRIRVDPTNPDRVYLCQYFSFDAADDVAFASGFWVSTDGGVSWTGTLAGLPRDLVIDPANPQILYLTMSRVDGGSPPQSPGLYQSRDKGETWSLARALPFDPNATFDVYTAVSSDGQTIYVYSGGNIANNFQINLVESTDAGRTWSPRSTNGVDSGQFGYNSYLEVDPNNPNTLYIGSRDVFKSTDAGGSWANLTNAWVFKQGGFQFSPSTGVSHSDQHSLTFIPNTPNAFYLGNDGGLSLSTDGGGTFTSLNTDLSLTQFYSMALDPGNPAISYGGTQDNGPQRRVSGNTWNQIITGDGGNFLINPADTQMIFFTDDGGNIFRYMDHGQTFDKFVGSATVFGESNSNPRIAFLCPVFNDGVHSTMYFGSWRLFKSTDNGDDWAPTAGNTDLTKGVNANGADVLTAGAVGPADQNVIYTGSAQGRVMVSTDGGSSWTDATGNLPNRSVTYMAVDHNNSSTAYVVFSGYNSGHVFKTVNMGATWTDISGNLPNLPVNTVAIDPRDSGTIYIGNDIAVFQSSFGGMIWQMLNTGMPPVISQALAANPTGLLQIGTYGRGAYQMTPPLSPPNIGIFPVAPAPSVAIGASIQIPVDVLAAAGFTGQVTLSTTVSPANPNVTATFSSPSVAAGGVAQLTLSASTKAAPRDYTVTISGSSGTLSATATLTLTVTGPSFSLGFTQPNVTGSPGTPVPVTVTVTPLGAFKDQVEVTAPTNLPTGIKVKGASQVIAKSGSAKFKFKITSAASAGTYQLQFTGTDTSTGLTQTATLNLTVN
ncbi:MAG TPA: hypothetical protein VLZ81_13575 [Blastocatellia bacterium]|nr:hypothetical protein [Blastocatellia bacterium]